MRAGKRKCADKRDENIRSENERKMESYLDLVGWKKYLRPKIGGRGVKDDDCDDDNKRPLNRNENIRV